MFANDLAAAQGCETDGSVRAGAVLVQAHDIFQSNASSFRDSPANRKGCAGWGIHFLAMVNFDNFCVVSRQTRAKLSGELQKKRQGGGEIGGLKDWNML
ncbi:hypothetical protein AA3271_1433 [Gluconobacter japonicus NBRC 3271]|nr:hypothetical protein AA3271_1433 [Gluconobacter japonicus NBRC 3271]